MPAFKRDSAVLICAVTFGPQVDLQHVCVCLETTFGPIADRSVIIDFKHTDYYTAEMGSQLRKLLVSFDVPFPPENLWLSKKAACRIEDQFRENGKRTVNLDPGYVEPSKLVLASTKNFSHRIYLHGGIYAEVTLTYFGGRFRKLPWTYPDYLEPEFVTFLERARLKAKLLAQVGH